MCNLYSVTKGQQAIRALSRAMRDTVGNLPLLAAVYPDYAAPIVRTAADGCGKWQRPAGACRRAFAIQGKTVDKV